MRGQGSEAAREPEGGGYSQRREPEERLEEAVRLTRAIGLDVRASRVARLRKPHPATLLGVGLIDTLKQEFDHQASQDNAIEVLVVDGVLTPIQQRNLERELSCKVIDRTGLILEIFGERARTREGRLQVELAALTYARSRLVRSWTHLERQRGGLGFVGGPGETQIEADRRMIDQKITILHRQLKEVERTRGLHRQARKRVPTPVVALVGYTNAGKSTLFNFLTQATVTARDQLFATLDPTMRRLSLPSRRDAVLSDTVGFISQLPHELVAAFRATLEEVCSADLVVHVRDIHSEESEAQRNDVLNVLEELKVDLQTPGKVIEVFNKLDLLTDEQRIKTLEIAKRSDHAVAISAFSGEGVDELLDMIDHCLWRQGTVTSIDIPHADGALLSWCYDHGEVLERRDDEGAVHLVLRLMPADLARLQTRLQGEQPRSGE